MVKLEKLDESIHAQNDVDESIELREACLADEGVKEEVRRFGLPEGLEVQCDPW